MLSYKMPDVNSTLRGESIWLYTGEPSELNIVLNSKDFSTQTKARVYRALVLSVLLYSLETWTMKTTDESKLCVLDGNTEADFQSQSNGQMEK